MLTLAGLGMLAGAGLFAGPALAAPAAGQSGSGTSANPAQARWDDDEVVGYYRTYRSCDRAGRTGERFDAWDDHDCERVRRGIRRGAYALIVSQDDWSDRWDSRWRPGQWPGNWSDRPQWPGPGRPNHGGPSHGGPSHGGPSNGGPSNGGPS
ncbi:hypothetical protein, partial [Actinoplanes palleronii]